MTLLILGDSITLGATEVRGNVAVGRVDRCYVDRLRQSLPRVQTVIDAGEHRTTSAALAKLPAALADARPDVVLVMLGGNDADLDWKRFILSDGRVVRNRVAVETFEQNLRRLVDAVTAAGAAAVLTDMPNHHFELRGPYVSALAGKDVSAMLDRRGGQAASDKKLTQFRDAVDRVGIDTAAHVVRYGRLLDQRPCRDMVGIDGVHPSSAAHGLIADALLPPLKRLLVERTPVPH